MLISTELNDYVCSNKREFVAVANMVISKYAKAHGLEAYTARSYKDAQIALDECGIMYKAGDKMSHGMHEFLKHESMY